MSKVNANSEAQAVAYGIVATNSQLERFLDLNMELNTEARQSNRPGRVPFIWGGKGIGKTESVRGWAEKRGYECIEVPLAQFEEMGDINGFPEVHDVPRLDKNGDPIIDENGQPVCERKTICVPPDWVPAHEGPGVLFFDDANRAEPRVQRGLMQLYQTYGMVSWKLPKGWMIVATGNPEDGEYDVSSFDEAQVTRLSHIQMKFDAKEWARWAENASVNEAGINFVLKYPELCEEGERTCPRTLVEWFRSLDKIGPSSKALKDRIDEVAMMGAASVDQTTVDSFINFLQQDSHLVMEPEDILKNPKATREHIIKLQSGKPNRTDIVSIINTRLLNYMFKKNKYTKKELDNYLAFLELAVEKKDGKPILPQEHAYQAVQAINESDNTELIELWPRSEKLRDEVIISAGEEE